MLRHQNREISQQREKANKMEKAKALFSSKFSLQNEHDSIFVCI
jgi:hypothetical protein